MRKKNRKRQRCRRNFTRDRRKLEHRSLIHLRARETNFKRNMMSCTVFFRLRFVSSGAIRSCLHSGALRRTAKCTGSWTAGERLVLSPDRLLHKSCRDGRGAVRVTHHEPPVRRDGNIRVAFFASDVFLRMSGYALKVDVKKAP